MFQETKTLKQFLIFSQKEAFLIFQEIEPFQAQKMNKFLTFWEIETSYISGGNSQSLEIKKKLYFFL